MGLKERDMAVGRRVVGFPEMEKEDAERNEAVRAAVAVSDALLVLEDARAARSEHPIHSAQWAACGASVTRHYEALREASRAYRRARAALEVEDKAEVET